MRVPERTEDLDEYEEEGEDLEDGAEYEGEEGEEEEEYEQEDPKPTKEELEYLELRQRLKEEARRRMRMESASAIGRSQEKKKLPYDNYGSFFGPSQPAIAQRVLEERRSILETQHIHARTPSSHSGMGLGSDDDDISFIWQSKKEPSSANVERKVNVRDPRPPPKAVNELKMKVQKLRDTRDYSFLMSDDAEFPAPAKEPAPRNVRVPSSDDRPAHVPLRSKASSMNKSARPVSNGHEERKSVSTSKQMPTKVVHSKAAPTRKPERPSSDSRKLLGSNVGNGPVRPLEPKQPFPKASATTMEKKKASAVSAKSSVPVANKAPLLKSQPTSQKHYLEQKKDYRAVHKPKVIQKQLGDKPKLISKQSVSSSKHQMGPPKKMPPRAMQVDRPKKRPMSRYSDEEDMDDGEEAIRMIRNMFGYNPKKYAEVDDDVSDMEANFDDILKEERRSAKIAREEDEREQRLIEEEERRMRLRKEAKKRKLCR